MNVKPLDEYRADKPLDGFWILDVGSGGGILSEVSQKQNIFCLKFTLCHLYIQCDSTPWDQEKVLALNY